MVNIQDAIKQIKQGKIHPIYLLFGTELYFIEEFKTHLKKMLGEKVNQDVITSYDLLETPIQEVIADVETVPFFTDKKIVIANNATFLTSKPSKLTITHELASLETYVNHPVDYSIFVLVVPSEKIDERKKITKLLKKKTKVIHCNVMNNDEIKAWIQHSVQQLNVTITDDACDLLEAEFQHELHLLHNELEKIALYVGEGGEITKEIVVNLISRSLSSDALELVDAVLKRDLYRSIKIAKELELRKEEPVGLIALLAYQFRIIFQVKLLKQKGYPNQRIQSELRVHPYVVKLAADRSSSFNEDILKNIIHELTNTDAKIKQGKVNKYMALELLLYKLIA